MLKMDRLKDQSFCLSVQGTHDSRTLVHDDSRYASHIRIHASDLTSLIPPQKQTQNKHKSPHHLLTSEFCGFMIVNPTYSAAASLYATISNYLRLSALLFIVSRHDHPYPRHHAVFHRVFCWCPSGYIFLAEPQLFHEFVFCLACNLCHDYSIKLRNDSNIHHASEYKPQSSRGYDGGEIERVDCDSRFV
ncbi:hypothetical protein C8R48DRAFT_780999 [Suillus tomentosus]|nr:hypothetical protein C8R48DRAFT_780999 [Suillus tomentosus]